jgi:hypothetical protein
LAARLKFCQLYSSASAAKRAAEMSLSLEDLGTAMNVGLFFVSLAISVRTKGRMRLSVVCSQEPSSISTLNSLVLSQRTH